MRRFLLLPIVGGGKVIAGADEVIGNGSGCCRWGRTRRAVGLRRGVFVDDSVGCSVGCIVRGGVVGVVGC